jgi:hypothetical protein
LATKFVLRPCIVQCSSRQLLVDPRLVTRGDLVTRYDASTTMYGTILNESLLTHKTDSKRCSAVAREVLPDLIGGVLH